MRKTWQVLGRNRNYLGIALGMFLVGLVLGGLFSESLYAFVKEGLEKIKDLAEHAQAKDDPLYTSQLIFWNNLKAALSMLLLGTLFCVFTLLMLLINGAMIGVVFSLASGKMAASPFAMIVFGLLPHGIFELPAILIAAAFGIKFGKVLLWPLAGKTRWQSYKLVWREVAQIAWLLLLLLVVAAAVEGMLTPRLLDAFAR